MGQSNVQRRLLTNIVDLFEGRTRALKGYMHSHNVFSETPDACTRELVHQREGAPRSRVYAPGVR